MNELKRILQPQAKATAYLNAKLDQERPACSPGTPSGLSIIDMMQASRPECMRDN
jgi:hypothetical protein